MAVMKIHVRPIDSMDSNRAKLRSSASGRPDSNIVEMRHVGLVVQKKI